MKNIKISFDLDPDAYLFQDCKTLEDSLHEALCLYIHEGNEDAWGWLQDNITNIG